MTSNDPPTYQRDTNEIALMDVIIVARERRWLLIGLTAVCLSLALAAAFLMTPVYRATVVMSAVERSESSSALGSLGGLAALAGIPLTDSAKVEEAIATLESRYFTEYFIDRHYLLPELFYSEWNVEKQEWKTGDSDEIPSLADGVEKLKEGVRSITRDATTGLLRLHIDWVDPQRGAEWANMMVKEVNDLLKEQAIEEAENSIAYLNQALTETSVVEARKAMYNVMETQIQIIMLANVREQYAFKVIDPAVPAEPDDIYRPNRILLVALGLFAGLIISTVLAIVLTLIRQIT